MLRIDLNASGSDDGLLATIILRQATRPSGEWRPAAPFPLDGVRLVASTSPRRHRLIDDLGRRDLRLITPFEVEEQFSDGYVILSHPALELCGYGRTLQDAIADFQGATVELYERLGANAPRLGPALAPVYEDLNRRIRRR